MEVNKKTNANLILQNLTIKSKTQSRQTAKLQATLEDAVSRIAEIRVGSQPWEKAMATHESLSEPRWRVEGRGRPGQAPPATVAPGLGTEGPGSRPGPQHSSGHKGDQGREQLCHFALPRSEHDAFPPAGRSPLWAKWSRTRCVGCLCLHSLRDVLELPKNLHLQR